MRLALTVLSAWGALACGCGYSREPAVLGKPEGPAGEREGGPAAPGASEQEDRAGYVESPMEMLDIPQRYTVRIEDEGMVLTADAAVEIPDVSGLGCHELINESFTEEDFERIGLSLADRLGIDWQKREALPVPEMEAAEGTENEAVQEIDTPDKKRLWMYRIEDNGTCYQADYMSFTEAVRGENGEIDPSFIWWVNLDDRRWEGHPTGSDTCGKSDPAMAERLSTAREFEEDAQKLLREWGMEEYQVQTAWWMKTSYSDRPDQYRYQIRCTPVFQGIPLGWSGGILGEESAKMSLPYARFDYLEDGTLDVVCLVGKADIRPGKDREMFLLPFKAAGELFEQYARDCVKRMADESGKAGEMTGRQPDMTKGQEAVPEPFRAGRFAGHIHVTRVTMEYAGAKNRDFSAGRKEEPETDSLVPVWTFYGYVEEKHQPERATLSPDWMFFGQTVSGNPYREMPLLSVRADDGQTFMGELKGDRLAQAAVNLPEDGS